MPSSRQSTISQVKVKLQLGNMAIFLYPFNDIKMAYVAVNVIERKGKKVTRRQISDQNQDEKCSYQENMWFLYAAIEINHQCSGF